MWKNKLYAVVFGLALALFAISGPIHESCHVIASFLVSGTGVITSWTSSYITQTPFTMAAGYYGEALVLAGLAIVAKRRYVLPDVITGVLISLGFEWIGSTDQEWLIDHGSWTAHAFMPFLAVLVIAVVVTVAREGLGES